MPDDRIPSGDAGSPRNSSRSRGSTRSEGALRRWEELTSGESGRFATSDAVAVLPLAAIEQHGPHLPLSTDLEIGMGILEAAARGLSAGDRVVVLPVQALGTSEEHLRYPGTLSLPPALLQRLLVAVGTNVASAGIRRLVVLNSHGGNRAVLDLAALQLRRELGMLVVKATYPRFSRPDTVDLPETEWRHGIHGGAIETAMMMHLRPDLVHLEAMASFPSLGEELAAEGSTLSPEGGASFAWLAGDLHPAGVTGDPRLATAEMGERLVEHYGRTLATVIREAGTFPLSRLV
jgi:creatinine amidohydrolase